LKTQKNGLTYFSLTHFAMKKLLLLILLALPLVTFAQTKPYLTLADAERITTAAEAKAKAEGWNVVIAILDDGGHLITLKRMDGVQVGSVEVAQAKAKSAVFFKRSTKVFEDAMKTEGGSRIATLPNAVGVEGGLPIFKDGVIVGAIGISGVTSAQDGIIAQAGVEAY
jgi:glc operon protein GlcG